MKNSNLQRATEFAVGLLFGWGLILAGMTDPGKVIGFLDLAGAWDPSLAFVMGGAIAVGFFAFGMAKKRTTNFFGGARHLPTSRDIDKRLVIGSLLFGAGLGLGWSWHRTLLVTGRFCEERVYRSEKASSSVRRSGFNM